MNTLNQWKHWPAFWNLVREHDICPESDKERLGECEIELWRNGYYSDNIDLLCIWSRSGYAGEVMQKMRRKDYILAKLNLSTYTPTKTAPLPIVKPCHICDGDHDEKYPTPDCLAKTAQAELAREADKYKTLWLNFQACVASRTVLSRSFSPRQIEIMGETMEDMEKTWESHNPLRGKTKAAIEAPCGACRHNGRQAFYPTECTGCKDSETFLNFTPTA